jgi:hypothetical protein
MCLRTLYLAILVLLNIDVFNVEQQPCFLISWHGCCTTTVENEKRDGKHEQRGFVSDFY